MNRRTGRLSLLRDDEKGELWVAEGRPAAARSGRTDGEKALFRLLSWREGSFRFAPDAAVPAGVAAIERSMDDALLEGMRQSDEVAQAPAFVACADRTPGPCARSLARGLPAPGDRAGGGAAPRPRARLQDVLDLTPAPDLDVLAVLAALLHQGRGARGGRRLRRRTRTAPRSGGGARLRTLALRQRGSTPRLAVAKVLPVRRGAVRASLPGRGARLRRSRPSSCCPCAAASARWRGSTISEALRVDLCVLPPADAAQPLWRPFSVGLVGGVLLEDSEGAVKLGQLLVRHRLAAGAAGLDAPLRAGRRPGAPRAGSRGTAGAPHPRACSPRRSSCPRRARWPELRSALPGSSPVQRAQGLADPGELGQQLPLGLGAASWSACPSAGRA